MGRHRFSRHKKKGHAIVELSLLAPWLFFLFVGAFDFGFYAYSLICVQNAARAAALYAAQTNSISVPEACEFARAELDGLPNVAPTTPCGSPPLNVIIVSGTDAELAPSVSVRVEYETVPLIPIPGLLTGKTMIVRTAEARIFVG